MLRFEFRRYQLPLRVAVRTAHGNWLARDGVIVRIENENGFVGFGEAAPIPWFGTETADEIATACGELGSRVSVERLNSVPEHLGCLRNAIAAALEQVQRRDEPNAREVADDVSTTDKENEASYRSVAALLPAGRAALREIPIKSEAGFRVFKWKVGVADIADELALLDDVCAELPEGAKLRLDANGAWGRRQTERWLERCAECPIEFLEQPIARDGRGADDLLRGLAADFPTPLALDESLVNATDVTKWIGAGWPGIYVIKPALLGNVERVLADLLKVNARVVFSSALETAVGAQAALRRAFEWSGERRALGFGVWPLFADGRFDGPTAVPFLRRDDVERINSEAVWTALS